MDAAREAAEESTNNIKHYDIVVIGAGAGAKISTPASKLGFRVALCEKERLGGTCVVGSTQVLMDDNGTTRRADSLHDGDEVVTVNPQVLSEEASQIYNSFQLSTEQLHDMGKSMYCITTINGRTITVTGDHPFLVQEHDSSMSWKEACDLVAGTKVSIRPALNLETPAPSPSLSSVKTILTKELFVERCKLMFKLSCVDHYAELLELKGLLPLKNNHPQLSILARLLGFALTDHGYCNDVCTVKFFTSQRPQDSNGIKCDIEQLGFNCPEPKDTAIGKITKSAHSDSVNFSRMVKLKNSGLGALLVALGLPVGHRSMQPMLPIQDWIMNGSQVVKREFLAGVMGGGGCCFQLHDNNLCLPPLRLHTHPMFSETLVTWLNQISRLFSDMGIITKVRDTATPLTPTSTVDSPLEKRDDSFKYEDVVALYFSNEFRSLFKLACNIGYRYSFTKNTAGLLAGEYLRFLPMDVEADMRKNPGCMSSDTPSILQKQSPVMNFTDETVQGLTKRMNNQNNSDKPQLPNKLFSPSQFFTKCDIDFKALDLREEMTFFMPLKCVRKLTPAEFEPVYDFTTRSENHSFIANGFVTHNCLNRGCIPSKMLIHSADVATTIDQASLFEVHTQCEYTVDQESLVDRVAHTIDKESFSIEPRVEANPNIDWYREPAKFIGDRTLRSGNITLRGEKIFIACGARAAVPDIEGLSETPYLTYREALRLKPFPSTMVIIGGGYIACELAHFFSSLGCRTTMLVRSKLLRRMDEDMQREFSEVFPRHKNIRVMTGAKTKAVRYDQDRNCFIVEYAMKKNEEEYGADRQLESEQLLVAAGITPNTDTLDVGNAGIELTDKGFIKVDGYLRTTAHNVWSFGDCAGNYAFRHSANFESDYLMATVVREKEYTTLDKCTVEPIDYGAMPSAVFTSPQIASVGPTEQELRERGVSYVKGINEYSASAMGMALRSTSGFVKILVDKNDRRILGAHIIGHEASTMIHVLIPFVRYRMTLDQLLGIIYIHPALPELVRNAARKARAALVEEGMVLPLYTQIK